MMLLMRDVQGSASSKLDMFEKVRAAGGFANEHPADLAEAEKMLLEFAAWRRMVGERGQLPERSGHCAAAVRSKCATSGSRALCVSYDAKRRVLDRIADCHTVCEVS